MDISNDEDSSQETYYQDFKKLTQKKLIDTEETLSKIKDEKKKYIKIELSCALEKEEFSFKKQN